MKVLHRRSVSTVAILAFAAILVFPACSSSPEPAREDELARRLRERAEELSTPGARGLPDTPNLHDLSRAEADRKAAIASARERLAAMEEELRDLPRTDEARARWLASHAPQNPDRATQVESFLYGCALDLMGERSRARYELERAARDTDFQPAALALGKWFYREGDDQAAQLHLRRALRLDDHDVDARLMLAEVYQKTRREAEAEQLVREALDGREPAHGEERLFCGLWLSSFLSRRARHAEIPAVLAPLAEEFDGEPQLHLRLASTYVTIGEAERAVHHFDRAVAIGETGFEQLLEYARALRLAGDARKSAEVYAKILNDAPEAFFERIPRALVVDALRLAREELEAGRRMHYDTAELLAVARNATLALERRVQASAILIERLPSLDARLVGELVEGHLHSEHVELQDYGVRYLGSRLPEEGLRILKELALDRRRAEKVRVSACVALRGMQRERSKLEACEALVRCLEDPSREVFHAAQASLERLTAKVATTWSREELDQEPEERRRVIERWKQNVEAFRDRVQREAR